MHWFRELGTGLQALVIFGGMFFVSGLVYLITSLVIDFHETIRSIGRLIIGFFGALFGILLFVAIQLRLPSAKALLRIALSEHWFLAPCAIRHMKRKDDLLKVIEQKDYDTERWARARLCTLYGHDWDGCKCRICGKTRNEQHKRVGCKCVRCGYNLPEWHVWEGCKCTRCGAVRNQEHDWSNGVFCTRCKAVQPHEHQWVYYFEEYRCPHPCTVEIPPFADEETWAVFCPGPRDCTNADNFIYDRCKICGDTRLRRDPEE